MSEFRKKTTIRAVCTDIDGTLLDSRRELSEQTISVIRKIRHSMPVVLASSRMPSAMRHLQKELDILEHPLICYNGGLVIWYDDGVPSVLHSTQIPLTVCATILAMGTGKSVHISLYTDDQWYAPGHDQWTEREATITKVSPILKAGAEVLDMWQKEKRGAHKVMIMGEAADIRSLEEGLRARFDNEIHVYHSKSTYLEIAPKIISKATALKLLLDKCYDIQLSEVIAFGDNYNDIEMLKSVGLGVAVDNARDEVKAVAKEITLAGKNDGVAIALSKYLIYSEK